ncbi:MAG TPA: phosphate ABC transporter permease subunit PstC [Bacteroidales bacterium]|nr:phosphate ABC transporter permease subunit PstC [Bacteroidales bacterium]
MRSFSILNFKVRRTLRENLSAFWMKCCYLLILAMPFILLIGLLLKSSLLFGEHSLMELIFSSEWKPLSGKFGFFPFIISSLWVTFISIAIAAPVCLLTAIYLTQYAKRFVLKIMQPVIDILAGIPSVIYGVWGIIIIVPFVSKVAGWFNVSSSGYSILTGAIVLAVMIIPFVLNILIEVYKTIPIELSEASLSLGATKWETIKKVLTRKAYPGIISSFGLGVSRAFGETIAVLMVVGNVVQIPSGIFQAGYPLPALIANNYGEMLSIPLYDSALMFAALILFVVVTFFNMGSRYIIMHYEKKI